MKVAFISGPYRAPTVMGIRENIRRAEAYALAYWKAGYAVICPHKNTALFDGEAPDQVWLDGDIELLKRCDVCVCIPGWNRSEGSKEERRKALMMGKEMHYPRCLTRKRRRA